MAMPRVAFVHLGSFSTINAALLDRLRAEFPEHDFEVADLRPLLRDPARLARMAPVALAEHLPALRGTDDLHWALETNSAAFRALSSSAAEHVRASGAAFSIQTQSLFDGAVDGVPHFVYTDHTALANRHYAHVGRPPRFPRRWLALERDVYAHARCTFVTGGNVLASLRHDYAVVDGAAATVYNGIALEPPASVTEKDYNSIDLVFVGVAWERKGGPELLRALDQLAPDHPGLRLTVVGCRPPEDRPWMEVVGRVPPAAVAAHLERATVFALPARLEPAGLAYSEAAAFGLPVIATDTGGIPDRVRDGETGLLVPPGDVRALRDALARVLSSAELRRRLGQAGRALAVQRFTWPAVGRAIADGIRARLE
jgi:glycosyltransferase involved in cell wall biosynthesis